MLKATEYLLKGSNCEGIRSPEDLAQRIKAASTADEWKGAGQKVGIEIWRIEQFQVKPVPTNLYGQFYTGDSYIVLKTNGNDDGTLSWDIHYWLGAETSIDEAGTAAYKSVELDDLLGGAPVEHREVQGYESDLFRSYFPKGIRILEGGVDSGFNIIHPEKYRTRLLQVRGDRKHIAIVEVMLSSSSMNSGDVFIVDKGLTIWQWNGSKSGPFERSKAAELLRTLDNERSGRPTTIVIDEGNETDEFWDAILGKGPIKPASTTVVKAKPEKRLFRLSDASGKLLVEEMPFSKQSLSGSDVFIVDTGDHIYVWVGSKSTPDEKRAAMHQAQDYLVANQKPFHLPITRIVEGQKVPAFDAVFA